MKKNANYKISFNKDYLRSVKREDFLKSHKHLEQYTDLGAEWDKVNKKDKPVADKPE